MDGEKIIAGLVSRNEDLQDEIRELMLDNQRMELAIRYLKNVSSKREHHTVFADEMEIALKIADMEDKEVDLIDISKNSKTESPFEF